MRPRSLQTCNYEKLYNNVKDIGVPVVLTEYGCNVFYWKPENQIGQRDWKQASHSAHCRHIPIDAHAPIAPKRPPGPSH